MDLSIETVKNYFGEKLAMYFLFITSYTKSISKIIIVSIVAHLLFITIVTNDYVQIFTLVGLSVYICGWNSMFLSNWKKKEQSFAIEFGQENFYKEDAIRSSYTGNFVRSPMNDEMNNLYYPETKRNRTTVMSYCISGLIILTAMFIFFLT